MQTWIPASALALWLLTMQPANSAEKPLAERRAMLALDQRCRLLPAGVRQAMIAGAQQARAALLRAGWSEGRIAGLEHAAAGAAARLACNSAEAGAASDRAVSAYKTWARQPNLTLTPEQGGWRAIRHAGADGWSLQRTLGPQLAFGLKDWNGVARPSLVWTGPPAASARLILRDPAKSKRPLPGVAAPAGASLNLFASQRQAGAFAFSDEALKAMALLDARDVVVVELAGADGKILSQTQFAIGDLNTALAFLAAH